jgi:hypothetical protein
MFSLTQNTAPKVKKTVLKSFVRIASCYRPNYLLCEHCAKYMKVPWKKENRKSKERLFFRERKDGALPEIYSHLFAPNNKNFWPSVTERTFLQLNLRFSPGVSKAYRIWQIRICLCGIITLIKKNLKNRTIVVPKLDQRWSWRRLSVSFSYLF